MDRRLFLTGLLGVAGTAALVTAMPRQAEALTDMEELRPEFVPDSELAEETLEEDGIQLARHGGPHRRHRRRYRRRRRRRYRRWRRNCYWRYGRRICRRRAVWIWGFI